MDDSVRGKGKGKTGEGTEVRSWGKEMSGKGRELVKGKGKARG